MNRPRPGPETRPTPPPLDSLIGDWTERHELENLFSLRNQWGQAHVNADLSSLSWLALPPFSGGYRTGVLSVNGAVLPAERLRWAPWGVTRQGTVGPLKIEVETRLVVEQPIVLWTVMVTNQGSEPNTVSLGQELIAHVAQSDVGWGWLYGTPWNHGEDHDFHTTERIRNAVLSDPTLQVQFTAPDARRLRIGRPRVAGIQRDEAGTAMVLTSELPDHRTSDFNYNRPAALLATVSNLVILTPESGSSIENKTGDQAAGRMTEQAIAGRWELRSPDDEYGADEVALGDGATLLFDLEPRAAGQTGVAITHGNHPDSLQIGLDNGHAMATVGGERLVSPEPLSPGRHRIGATITARGASLSVDGDVVAVTDPWWGNQRWQAEAQDGAVTIVDGGSEARARYTFDGPEPELTDDAGRGLAAWNLEIPAGSSVSVGIRLALSSSTSSETYAPTGSFTGEMDGVPRRWQQLWDRAFDPKAVGQDHSGYLPVLETADADLAQTYYLGALLVLYMRNTGVSPMGPVFLTGGPRLGPTVTFYWDQAEWPRTAAMLEPVGLRKWILAALAQPYESSHSFDTRNHLPIGNRFAANDHALFRTVEGYISVTGDLTVLGETAGGRQVIDHLVDMAFRPLERSAGFVSGPLVDFGSDPWELLECVPRYRHGVASFNAGYVGMLDSLANLWGLAARDEEMAEARILANDLADSVLDLFDDGRWRVASPTGEYVIGHCLDFVLTTAGMADRLKPELRRQMIDFVENQLLDGDWMRALDPGDDAVSPADRPDHGALGAFAAWPGSTAYGMSHLGYHENAVRLLGRVHRARGGALWGQAVEAIGDGKFRTAERDTSNRDSSAAAAVTEAVLGGLFDISGHFGRSNRATTVSRWGQLFGVRAVGHDLPPPEAEMITKLAELLNSAAKRFGERTTSHGR